MLAPVSVVRRGDGNQLGEGLLPCLVPNGKGGEILTVYQAAFLCTPRLLLRLLSFLSVKIEASVSRTEHPCVSFPTALRFTLGFSAVYFGTTPPAVDTLLTPLPAPSRSRSPTTAFPR